jgi:hypothetical protein
MKELKKEFSKYLKNIYWPTKEEEKEQWNISGILKRYSNEFLKFDVRDMKKLSNELFGKYLNSNSKADKIVFRIKNDWLIVDYKTLINYVINKQIKIVYLDDLVNNLDWNIKINKNEF